MYKILVKFEVRDYPIWKKGFDSGAGPRRAAGIETADILSAADSDKKVVVIFQTSDLEKAKAQLANPEVKKGQADSGFLAPPELFFGKVM